MIISLNNLALNHNVFSPEKHIFKNIALVKIINYSKHPLHDSKRKYTCDWNAVCHLPSDGFISKWCTWACP